MSTLTAVLADIRKISPEAEVIVGIVQTIQTATGLGGTAATAVLAAAQAALHQLESTPTGEIDAATVLADMEASSRALAAQFAADETAIDTKFPTGGS